MHSCLFQEGRCKISGLWADPDLVPRNCAEMECYRPTCTPLKQSMSRSSGRRKLPFPPFPVGWHSLRHTFSTLNGNAGAAVPVLQSLLGYASPETTMVDTHPLEDVKRQAVADLASLLFPNVPSKQKIISKGSELIQ